MIITRIEEMNGKRYRVFGDERFLFSLYNKELKQFNIQEDCEINDETVSKILDDILYKRARERALYLLERKSFSVHMMREKLYRTDYPISVIDRVIDFLMSYNYLNDIEYVRMYANTYSISKSKKQVIYDLKNKGIAKAIIDDYFLYNDFSEQECFAKQYKRYVRGKNLQDFATQQKVFQHFYRKGFSASLIERYIRKVDE